MFFKRYAHLFRWLFVIEAAHSLSEVAFILKQLPLGSFVVLRCYEHLQRKSLAHWLSRMCRKLRLTFLVAGDPFVALLTRASGVHVRESSFSKMRKWRYFKKQWFISCASHSVKQNLKIQAAGFDAALFSPVFHSKKTNSNAMGAVKFIKYQAFTRKINVFALGGITKANIWKLREAGQKVGIAGINLYNDRL
ncbi:thiamine phosphate synthase [Neorickettsia findlayensis]|uniref:Thiamine phosphate synthase n=1 Tax=Neorickettsia findlayensis TaxID=2686014 RepID=A0A6P1G9U0_9RICK|nr:thiamine phosphate synthase [Neorickettsia findlayensis]QHD65115.1 thiamine phosphate synthase [Neorickettsia findlayensis]